MKNTPERPATVPKGAYWVESDREWVSGPRNPEDRKDGIVEYYRADGTLCCATEYVDGIPHGPFHRYHENGEVSREGQFVHGKLHGTDKAYRSTSATTENFPVDLVSDKVWHIETDYKNGDIVRFRFYDRKGKRVSALGPDSTPTNEVYVAVSDDTPCAKKDSHKDFFCWKTRPSDNQVRDHINRFWEYIREGQFDAAFQCCPIECNPAKNTMSRFPEDVAWALERMFKEIDGYGYFDELKESAHITPENLSSWVSSMTPPKEMRFKKMNLKIDPGERAQVYANCYVQKEVTDVTALFTLFKKKGNWYLAYQKVLVM